MKFTYFFNKGFIQMWETNVIEATLLLKIQSFEEQALKFTRKEYSRKFWHMKKFYDLWKLGFMRPYIIRINGGLVLLYFPSSSGLEWKQWIRWDCLAMGRRRCLLQGCQCWQQDHWISSIPGDMEVYLWLELPD